MNIRIPLNKNTIGEAEKKALIKVFDSGYMTMGKVTKEFEKKFAKHLGVKHAIYVNSGSSANLLAFFSIINPLQKNKIPFGSECLIPGLCWSTSLWPIVQTNLVPKFVDIDFNTFNLDINEVEKNITNKTKAICAVHILGNSTNMTKLAKIAKENNESNN